MNTPFFKQGTQLKRAQVEERFGGFTVLSFGMAVKIISGFYLGCTGLVTDFHTIYHPARVDAHEYLVEMNCKMANGRTERLDRWVLDTDLVKR